MWRRGNTVVSPKRCNVVQTDKHFGNTTFVQQGGAAIVAIVAITAIVFIVLHENGTDSAPTQEAVDRSPASSTVAPIRETRPFTPKLNTNGARCSHNQLCAYRGAAGTAPRFDLAVNAIDRGVCYTVSSADPGFATTYNGSGYRVNLYPLPGCAGTPQVAPLNVNTVSEFHFFSYATF